MPQINLSITHNLGQDEAKRRITGLLADSRTRFAGKLNNMVESWNGYTDAFSFDALGFSVDGKLDVEPAQVHIEMNLPWAAYPLKGRIEDEILSHARQLLG
jgi:predicted NBD/HSP70 family sugar kinase